MRLHGGNFPYLSWRIMRLRRIMCLRRIMRLPRYETIIFSNRTFFLNMLLQTRSLLFVILTGFPWRGGLWFRLMWKVYLPTFLWVNGIDLAVGYITKGNPGIKLSTSDLKGLFLFTTAETHFIFKGPPLAPVLANLFMGHHEKIWLGQCRDSQVLSYRRYVDDSFCLFNSKRDADLFINFINNQHPNIHFTMERESNQVLPFLDVLLNNKSPQFPVTTVYHKKTFQACLQIF